MEQDFQTILLRAKEDVYALLQGGNFSKILGQGYDFSELRAYESSDDIRHISWINSAKLGEPYVKKMHEERELNVAVCMLVDGRMIIGKKQKTLSYVLALLGYSATFTNNRFHSSLFLGSKVKSFEASKNVESVEKSLKELSLVKPLGLKLDNKEVSLKLLKELEQRTLLFVVGDFLDMVDLSVLAQKHEVYAIVVRDRWEENPTLDADAELLNPVSNKTMSQMPSKKALRYYVTKLQEHDEKLERHFMTHNIKHVKVYEPNEVLEKLERLFYQ